MESANNSIIVEPSKTSENKIVPKVSNPYLQEEYVKFIQTVKNGEIPEHWEMLAETLGITRKTIERWKTMPEFSAAINKGLDEALAKMKETGGKDWKMWRERVAILSREANKQNNSQPITINTQINLDGYGDSER